MGCEGKLLVLRRRLGGRGGRVVAGLRGPGVGGMLALFAESKEKVLEGVVGAAGAAREAYDWNNGVVARGPEELREGVDERADVDTRLVLGVVMVVHEGRGGPSCTSRSGALGVGKRMSVLLLTFELEVRGRELEVVLSRLDMSLDDSRRVTSAGVRALLGWLTAGGVLRYCAHLPTAPALAELVDGEGLLGGSSAPDLLMFTRSSLWEGTETVAARGLFNT